MAVPSTTALKPLGVGRTGATAQQPAIVQQMTAATADGSGAAVDVLGINGAISVEITKTGTGTVDILPESTFDSVDAALDASTWWNTRYNTLGSSGGLTPGAGAISLGAGTQKKILSILDVAASLRLSLANTSGSVAVSVRLLLIPQ